VFTDIYQYTNYKAYLRSACPAKGEGRGARTRLAEYLNCHLGFVSQVLTGSADFSIEHGILIAEFLKLSEQEKEYFLLLLQRDRAGSVKLKTYFQAKIQAVLQEREQIKSRIQHSNKLTEAQKTVYYGKWIYTAVHMCTLVPRLRTAQKMRDYLEVPAQDVHDTLRDLLEFGLITQKGTEYYPSSKRFHISEKSLPLRTHHTNWRLASIRALDDRREPQLHYSSVMSISPKAANEIREILLKAIENTEPVVREAQDESVFVMTLDLFELGTGDQ
jgi:uncharacterized protein (TIGR02147 family)